jgi:zinc finger SWIM domain-containing protein 3
VDDGDAKRGFPPTRKSNMYDYSDSVQRYHELHNISQKASFAASQLIEAYQQLKRVLEEEAAMITTNRGDGGGKRFGPVLPQAHDVDSVKYCNVFDPNVCLEEGPQRKS